MKITDFEPSDPPAGWPDAETAGLTVPESSLSSDLSALSITANGYTAVTGQVVENLLIDGRLTILGHNVIVRNCRIVGDAGNEGYGIEIRGGTGIIIENNVIGKDSKSWPNSVKGICIKVPTDVSATIESNYIRYVDDGIFIGNGSSSVPSTAEYELIIRDNYITYVHSYDPASPSDHVNQHKGDGIEVLGPLSNSIIEHNSIESPVNQTSCILIQPNWAPVSDVVIDGNWLNGAGYSLKVRARNYGITGIEVTDNVFGHDYQYGSWDCDVELASLTGNTYVSGESVPEMNE